MCDAIDVVKTQTGTAELLMQDAIMIETCPHPLVAGARRPFSMGWFHGSHCAAQSTEYTYFTGW